MIDYISRQAVIDVVKGIDSYFVKYIEELPSAQPYTEEEIQKMQDLEQAELEKAFELGKAEANKWIPCCEPPEDDRSVFIAYGDKKLKSCCIGFYEPSDKCWREQRNFFATLIYDAKYWCDMPELPEGWYE